MKCGAGTKNRRRLAPGALGGEETLRRPIARKLTRHHHHHLLQPQIEEMEQESYLEAQDAPWIWTRHELREGASHVGKRDTSHDTAVKPKPTKEDERGFRFTQVI